MTAALPISRALRQSDRNSATNRPIASSTSAAARGERNAGDRFPRGEREQHRLGRESVQGRRRIEKILPVLPVGSAMDVDQQFSPQAGDPDRGRADDRRSRRRGWRAGPAEKPGASFTPNRANARSSWTVSRNPSRQAASEARPSRPSARLGSSQRRAADLRGNHAQSAASSSSDYAGRRLASEPPDQVERGIRITPRYRRARRALIARDTSEFPVPPPRKKLATSVLRSAHRGDIRRSICSPSGLPASPASSPAPLAIALASPTFVST